MIKRIINSILVAFYQPFWAALLMAICFMFFYLFVNHADEGNKGWKGAVKTWISFFIHSKIFRKVFLLSFYVTLVLFRTLLNRELWIYPLQNVMGGWWIWERGSDGTVTFSTACIENVILLLPYTMLILSVLNDKSKFPFGIRNVLVISCKVAFMLSTGIEFFQLILRIGNFQISDIIYNTLGGFVGGLIYWIGWKVKHRRSGL